MELKERLNEDLRAAMRTKDEIRKSAIRMALSAIRYAEIARGEPLDDTGVQQVLAKEAKQRRESIEEFKKGGRTDLVNKEQAEIEALTPYLPEQIDEAAVQAMAQRIIAETGAASAADKGRVMPLLMKEISGRADGRLANEVVTRLLAS
ncbi:MAG TPA: GatB/YqeY domain-containing protein [Dehalococcoidia bacterium]|nr:GatB/YqeY domain-containing protein [Dehalococcoidia bacterium]